MKIFSYYFLLLNESFCFSEYPRFLDWVLVSNLHFNITIYINNYHFFLMVIVFFTVCRLNFHLKFLGEGEGGDFYHPQRIDTEDRTFCNQKLSTEHKTQLLQL
ncbi:MAG: hypothetical protein CK539_05640, partial [Flavobacteriales bacterium]